MNVSAEYLRGLAETAMRRHSIYDNHPKSVADALNQFADLLEAQAKAEPVYEVVLLNDHLKGLKGDIDLSDLPVGAKLYLEPPTTPTGVGHQFPFEAACSGLRYESPEACGEVSAIHINGKRWPLSDLCKEKQAQVVDEKELRTAFECSWLDIDTGICLDRDELTDQYFTGGLEDAWLAWKSCAEFFQARAKLGQTTDKACSAVVPDGFVLIREDLKRQLLKDSKLARVAMRFVDRAGDTCKEDTAETICAEFNKAMRQAIRENQQPPTMIYALSQALTGATVSAVPDGCQLVPKEATKEMKLAGKLAMFSGAWTNEEDESADIYRAMLAAAPQPETLSPSGEPDGFDAIYAEIKQELSKAIAKFQTWPTDPLHAVGVVNEEVGEIGEAYDKINIAVGKLNKTILQAMYEKHKSSIDDVRKEAVQSGAMILRFLRSMDVYDFTPGRQHEQSLTPPKPEQGK